MVEVSVRTAQRVVDCPQAGGVVVLFQMRCAVVMECIVAQQDTHVIFPLERAREV